MANPSEKIAVLGAGTMGAGIAQVAAQAGFQTLVYDIKQEFIDIGLGKIKSFLQGSRERGKINAEQEQEILGRFHSSTSLDDAQGSTLVIEAAPEKLELKRDIFKQLDAICGPETLLATNTSSFNVTAIAAATQHQERVLGLHFFNPPPLMALVEVIQGDRTSSSVIEKATTLMKAMGKTPARAKDTPGFIVNRIARPFYNEGLRVLGDGNAAVETIDRHHERSRQLPHGAVRVDGSDRQRHQLRRHRIALSLVFRRSAFSPEPDSAAHGRRRQSRAQDRTGFLQLWQKVVSQSSAKAGWPMNSSHWAGKRGSNVRAAARRHGDRTDQPIRHRHRERQR